MGAGTILREVIAAAELLASEFDIKADVFSVTSFNELARDAVAVERHNRLSTGTDVPTSFLQQQLQPEIPVIVATDYVRALPQQIAPFIDAQTTILGTDGYGRSANRPALRRFFEVDRQHIALAAIEALYRQGKLDASVKTEAISSLGIDQHAPAPWTV
jgi:pyruvate dehydrogenase E1 component